ncbi:threonine synthase [Candidatus Woesearchaeota archaeon]|nr:threonine synthase [Candidatus Woesearchaeota archaeon]
MHVKSLQCYHCGKKYPRSHLVYHCSCGGSFEIIYDYSHLKKHLTWRELRKRSFNHWRYKEFYPFLKEDKIVTLKEGATPLVESALEKDLWFKNETLNPTGSFKDRGSTIEISQALSQKAKRVICASTGNMGASVAAYSARAKLPCTIVMPRVVHAPEKIAQMKHFKAKIITVPGDYAAAEKHAYMLYQKKGSYLVGDYCYRGEGEKSIGFEILDQMKNVDFVFCPIGNGTLISGLWKAMKELKKVGLVKKLPQLMGVQALGCNTVVKAWKEGKKIKKVIPKTLASAIACGNPLDGEKAVHAFFESQGKGILVSDKEILSAQHRMQQQGLDVEPSGAVAYAGYLKIKPKGKCIALATGHGLKCIK